MVARLNNVREGVGVGARKLADGNPIPLAQDPVGITTHAQRGLAVGTNERLPETILPPSNQSRV
jgi:hypothetical protein